MLVLLGALLSGVAAKCMQSTCKQVAKPCNALSPPSPGFITLPPNQNCHAMQSKNFQNHVHSQDVLAHRMVVCTAHLCHPLPHHHKKDGASFSILSITIGKKGD